MTSSKQTLAAVCSGLPCFGISLSVAVDQASWEVPLGAFAALFDLYTLRYVVSPSSSLPWWFPGPAPTSCWPGFLRSPWRSFCCLIWPHPPAPSQDDQPAYKEDLDVNYHACRPAATSVLRTACLFVHQRHAESCHSPQTTGCCSALSSSTQMQLCASIAIVNSQTLQILDLVTISARDTCAYFRVAFFFNTLINYLVLWGCNLCQFYAYDIVMTKCFLSSP